MKLLLSIALCSSFAFGANLVCSNENRLTSKQTIFVMQGGTLMAICQRSLVPGAQNLTNQEICIDDMYTTQSSSTGTLGSQGSFVSLKTSTVFNSSIGKNNQGIIDVVSDFNGVSFKGANKISIPKGKIQVTCK